MTCGLGAAGWTAELSRIWRSKPASISACGLAGACAAAVPLGAFDEVVAAAAVSVVPWPLAISCQVARASAPGPATVAIIPAIDSLRAAGSGIVISWSAWRRLAWANRND